MTMKSKKAMWATVAGAVMAMQAGLAQAQAPVATNEPSEDGVETATEIVVPGEIKFRDRVDSAAPQLDYGAEYFQRFEPLTVGDALKRVPSVAFLSDVLESDGVRLRGLAPAYTQILINGERVPGAGSGSGGFNNGVETAFFVDRIPAELIDRVEVVRSASANRSGDAIAGAINIVLRDGMSLDGGYVRAGLLHWQGDQTTGGTGSVVWGGEFLGGRALFGANIQDRHNPKEKFSARYRQMNPVINLAGSGGQNTGNSAPFSQLGFYNIEDQTDVRDGTDYSLNFAYEVDALGGEVTLDGFYVRTERTEDEDSIEYRFGIREPAQLFTVNDNNVEIEQDSLSLNAGYEVEWFGGETEFKFGFARFTNTEDEFEDENEFLRDAVIFPEADRYTGEKFRLDIDDTEYSFKVEHEIDLSDDVELEFGVQTEEKSRDSKTEEATPRVRVNLPAGTTTTTARPPASFVTPAFGPFAPVPGGDTTIERTRIDPYVMLTGETGPLMWEAGLRVENTELQVRDRTTTARTRTDKHTEILPSVSAKLSFSEDDRGFLSIARTVRLPSFSLLSPALLEEELGDNDFIGNPSLKPETAVGIDIGYERRLGRTGVAGVNFFYRSIDNLVETFNTGAVGSAGAGTFVYSARNTGDGDVWGVELDLSTPLTIFNWDNTGVFVNYSWLDSEIKDEFGARRFNDQASSVFNIGFIQDLPDLDAAFGATYRKQGNAFGRVLGEEVRTSYGADLEVFVEKRFGQNFTLRFTGSNLLDSQKRELFDKFNTLSDQGSRVFSEFELETEEAGPVFQLIGRYAFQ